MISDKVVSHYKVGNYLWSNSRGDPHNDYLGSFRQRLPYTFAWPNICSYSI